MNDKWSERIAAEHQLQLPDDVRCWLDDELWRRDGGAEFCEPSSPAQLLEPDPGSVWGGFMQPDSLPIIGNRYGDWLCLRIDSVGRVVEVIYWAHGGGDWIPYGRSLSEALIYDAVNSASDLEKLRWRSGGAVSFEYAEWARRQLRLDGETEALWKQEADPVLALRRLDLSPDVVQRDLILRLLDSGLRRRSGPELARRLSIPWEPDLVRCLFDTSLMSEPLRKKLVREWETGEDELFEQDWDQAEEEALQVCHRRTDLSWAYDVAGWAAQRRGDARVAVERYLQGIRCSLFSDDTVRFRTHWCEEGFGKFAAARLAELAEHLPSESSDDPYVQLFLENNAGTLKERIRDYWIQEAERAGTPEESYLAYRNAGWDVGLSTVDQYGSILDRLAETADAAGWKPLASLARLHRRFL